ncbi:MAG: hypothetical protein AAF993_02755 [Pseudomonadota bacterium]
MNNPAALPWYNLPQTRPTLDAMWEMIRGLLTAQGYAALPERLSHALPYQTQWSNPQTLLSQCCGLDLAFPHSRSIEPVAVPVMGCLDSAPGTYYSVIIKRAHGQVPTRLKVAVNSKHSHSGHTNLYAWLHREGLVADAMMDTGSHQASSEAVRSGFADLAAIDAYTWQYLNQADLGVAAVSQSALAPPFVTGVASPIKSQDLYAALDQAVHTLGRQIGWTGLRKCSRADYEPIARLAATLTVDEEHQAAVNQGP